MNINIIFFVFIRGFPYLLSYFRPKGFGHFDIFPAISANARVTGESVYFS